MDYYHAESTVKRAAIVAIILFFISGFKILTMFMSNDPSIVAQATDPFTYVDVVLLLVCAIMVLRYSRTAAVLLFLQYTVSKFMIYSQYQQLPVMGLVIAGVITLVIVAIYINGIRGAFAYHRLKKEDDADYKPAAKWTYYTGIPIAIIIVLLIGIGLMTETGILPSVEVISGSELAENDRQALVDKRIIKTDEKIKFFYSNGITSNIDDGNIMTDKRVISYETIDGKLGVYSATFDEIEKITIQQENSDSFDTVVEVSTTNGSGFYLILSNTNHGDERFVDAVENQIYTAD
jgi:hypothetical protein